MLSGGIIVMNPNKEHVFRYDFMDVYEQDKRDFYPKAPGINLFLEAKSRMEFTEFTAVNMGLGYWFYRYEVAFMQDFYFTTGMVKKLTMSMFINFGLEFGIRHIRYSDVEYKPNGATGFFLDQYDEKYDEAINKYVGILRLNFGIGYMF